MGHQDEMVMVEDERKGRQSCVLILHMRKIFGKKGKNWKQKVFILCSNYKPQNWEKLIEFQVW